MAKKTIFWHSLNNLANSFNGPWICLEDFNCIMAQWEKQHGLSFASNSDNPLISLMEDNGMVDLSFIGQFYLVEQESWIS